MVPPRTARSVVPGVGRLGLVEPTATEDLASLGWQNTDAVPLLWSLSRAPDADLALRTLMRLRDELDAEQWSQLDEALHHDKPLRGRLFGLIGSSIALADHLLQDPTSWHRLREARLESKDELVARLLACVEAEPETGPNGGQQVYRAGVTGNQAIAALRKCYRDQIMVLAAIDLAAVVEDEPVLAYRTVGYHLADLADAALTAALAVAIATVCPDEPVPVRLAVIAMGKCGARELNYVSDVDVVFVAEPANSVVDAHRRGADADRYRVVLRGRRGAAARGQAWRTDPGAGRAPRLLPALGQDLGVPGAAQGAADDRGHGTRPRVSRDAHADGVGVLGARGLRAGGAADAPARREPGSRRPARARTQAGQRQPARRRIRRPVAATGARSPRRVVAGAEHRRGAQRAGRGRVRGARRRRQPHRLLRVPATARAPAAAAALQAHAHPAARRRRRGAALARPRRAHASGRAPATRWVC